MGVGDPTGTVREGIDKALDRLGRSDLKRQPPLQIDRTSSMTVAQVMAFWRLATEAFVEQVHWTQANQGVGHEEALLRVVRNEPRMGELAEKALRKVFER